MLVLRRPHGLKSENIIIPQYYGFYYSLFFNYNIIIIYFLNIFIRNSIFFFKDILRQITEMPIIILNGSLFDFVVYFQQLV